MNHALELPRVTAVRHVRAHVLWLEFSDGLSGELDLASDLAGPVFEPLHVRLSTVNGLSAEPNGADSDAPPDHDTGVPELSSFMEL